MTVKQLKEILEKVPDNTFVYMEVDGEFSVDLVQKAGIKKIKFTEGGFDSRLKPLPVAYDNVFVLSADI